MMVHTWCVIGQLKDVGFRGNANLEGIYMFVQYLAPFTLPCQTSGERKFGVISVFLFPGSSGRVRFLPAPLEGANVQALQCASTVASASRLFTAAAAATLLRWCLRAGGDRGRVRASSSLLASELKQQSAGAASRPR